MHHIKFLRKIFLILIFITVTFGCTAKGNQNNVSDPRTSLFGTWTWTQDEDYRIQAVISADTIEYEFHNLGNHSVSVTLSDITWVAEDNSELSNYQNYPTGYKVQGTVTANSIYIPENAIWPEDIGNTFYIMIFPHQTDSQKALILYDELDKQS